MTRRVAATVLGACLAMAGCSIGTDVTARPVDDAPDRLLDPTTTTISAIDPDDDSFNLTLVFINANGRRVKVDRPRETPPTVQDVLDGLTAQPSEAEQAIHADNLIRTVLLPSMAPIDDGIENGVLRVTVQGPELQNMAQDAPESLRLIYGQVVCSIVELDDPVVSLVEIFDIDGRINALPDGGAVAPIERPVGANDYNDCATAAEIAAAEAEAEGVTDTNEDG